MLVTIRHRPGLPTTVSITFLPVDVGCFIVDLGDLVNLISF